MTEGAITQKILVAGIGNIFLGDDGFGPEVLRHVHPDRPEVRAVDYGIAGMHLAYDLLDGWDALILVDALPDRGTPGAVHIFAADHESRSATPGLDAHAMDPGTVFASLRALGGTAPHTVVVGCEVGSTADGIGLTAPVAAAVPRAVGAVERVITDLLSGVPSREG